MNRRQVLLAEFLAQPGRADGLVRLLEAGGRVQRRSHFFVWLQSHLQALLPHEVAVCGHYHRTRRELVFAVYDSVVLEAAARQLLADGHSPLLRAAIAAWVQGGGQPLHLAVDAMGAPPTGAGALVTAGLHHLLVHGVARPQRPAELETFFLFGDCPPAAAGMRAACIELLIPFVHCTWQRVQALESGLDDAAAPASVAAAGAGASALTPRELQVLAHVREGLSNREIGAVLGLSTLTVKNHVQHLLRKLGASNRAQAVAKTASN